MSSLKDLYMSRCELTDLPAEFCQLQELRSLSLRSNNFTELPSAIYKLSKLERLGIGCNKKLKVIEKEILQLTRLTDFNCGGCSCLKSPPYDVCKLGLTAVKRHFQDGALIGWYRHSGVEEIDELPPHSAVQYKQQTEAEIKETVGDHHITYMWIKGELPTLDDIGSHITHLGIYSISHPTQLERLNKLPNLSVLGLKDCVLSSELAEVITRLTSLKELRLRKCQFIESPEKLSSLHQLEKLNPYGNKPSQVNPPVVSKKASSKELEMTSCEPADLPTELKKLPNLSVLELYDCNFPSRLPKWITQLASLKELRLQRCQLTELPEGLSSLHQLEKLDLSYNNFFQGIPPEIGEISSLKDLNMSSCQLTDLPAEFCQLQELRSLSLESNNFTELPSAIYKLSKLERLDMRTNKELKIIEKEILQLTSLADFNCGGCLYLKSPSYYLCEQGLTAVREYFQDLSGESANQEAAAAEHWECGKAYLNLVDDLDEFLNTENVSDYLIYQDVDDDCKINVTGPKVARLQSQLQDVKNKSANCNRFTLSVTDFTPDQPDAPNMWINQFQSVKCLLSDGNQPDISVIELMLKSHDENSQNTKYYAATTAHSFLMEPQKEKLIHDDSIATVQQVWDELGNDGREYSMLTNVEQVEPVNIVSQPFPFFRHFYRHRDKLSPSVDIGVCELNGEQLREGGWLSGEVDCSRGRQDAWNRCPVKEIQTRDDLMELRNRVIFCKGQPGKIGLPQLVKQRGRVMGLHLSFTLHEGSQLAEGDCGSLVYLRAGETDPQNCIVGMLFGELDRDPRIYVAVILSKNLQKMRDSLPALEVYQPAD